MGDGTAYDGLSFDRFRELARQKDLNRHERVGFPSEYREGFESAIFRDVLTKVPQLDTPSGLVVEIGPGCSDLPRMLLAHCQKRGSALHLVDSQEMLDYLPDAAQVTKWPGRFPEDGKLVESLCESVNAIIVYSVVQYVFAEGNLWDFIDSCLALLAPGGQLFLGDIPNVTMRKRFFASESGRRMHADFTGDDKPPVTEFSILEPGRIDDSVVFSILSRARAEGFHSWVLPQGPGLPMANRREDVLIQRP